MTLLVCGCLTGDRSMTFIRCDSAVRHEETSLLLWGSSLIQKHLLVFFGLLFSAIKSMTLIADFSNTFRNWTPTCTFEFWNALLYHAWYDFVSDWLCPHWLPLFRFLLCVLVWISRQRTGRLATAGRHWPQSYIYGGTPAASSPEGHKYFALPVWWESLPYWDNLLWRSH